MKKTLMSSAIATVLAASGLSINSAWASDREIYQRGGEGSVAVMMMLDVSRTMRQKFGTLDDGSSDYYGCVHSTDKQQNITIGDVTLPVRYCTYTDGTMNFNEFFLRKKFPSYREYIKQTCDYVKNGTALSNPEYRCYDRLTRAKIALISLLNGNADRQIAKLSDDKVIGLSIFPAFLLSDGKFDSQSGSVRVPARRLDAEITLANSTTKTTQRKLLVSEILNTAQVSGQQGLWDKLFESDEVPLAPAYADTAAYLMGTSTSAGFRESERAAIDWEDRRNLWNYKFSQDSRYTRACRRAAHSATDPTNWDEYGQCGGWLEWENKDFNPNYSDMYSINQRLGLSLTSDTATFLINDNTKKTKFSGMYYANPSAVVSANTSASNKYIAPEIINKQTADPSLSQCHAQGIYMITGGLSKIRDLSQGDGPASFYVKRMMNRSLNSKENLNEINFKNNFCANGKLTNYRDDTYTENTNWDCISEYAERLKTGNNAVNLNIKTAVVGVGKQFADIPSVNVFESDENNQAVINQAVADLENYKDKGSLLYTSSTRHNLKNTALLGVYGGGGWYSAMSVSEIAGSFNSFVNSLAKDIPSASTNKTVIPVDILNPYELQPYAYLNMYEPTVQKATVAWAGNLKRYKVGNAGAVVDADGTTNIFNANGTVKDNVKDLWEDTILDDAQKFKVRMFQGGALNKIELGQNSEESFKRKIYTTRDCKENEAKATCAQDATVSLKELNSAYFTNTDTAKDSLRGYLLALLGYNITNPSNISDEEILNIGQQQPELRQMGAILHSDPVLLTQKGKVTGTGQNTSTTDREDYVLFGTTQGLLHVLDAETGKEKFAFVPNEMVEKNHKTFVNPDVANTTGDFLYGIDGAWTVHTEYVAANKSDQSLTVGTGTSEDITGKQWAYGGLRMGGRSYYALDLTDLEQPKVKFHIDPDTMKVYTPTKTTQYTPLKAMGQSWSKPVITRVNWQGQDKLVMIVGGGYDNSGANQGYEYPTYVQSTEMRRGAGVYMFDADNGDLLWWSSSNVNNTSKDYGDNDGITPNEQGTVGHHVDDMGYSVVSAIKTVDRDGDGLTDHLYFGDLGGQVWRVDFNNFATDKQPFAKHVVRLLKHDGEAGKHPRFYAQPTFSIYRTPGAGRVMAAISIGSGNASRPLHDPTNEANWQASAIYTLFDKDVTRSNLYTMQTTALKQDLAPTEIVASQRQGKEKGIDETKDGWKYVFSSNAVYLNSAQTEGQKFYSTPMGAKVITDPVLMNNQLFVSVFDGAKSGTVQGCDAGIKGESVIERFCMPFGSCDAKSGLNNSLYAGVGIAPINISSAGQGAKNSRTIINSNQCEGDTCKVTQGGSNVQSNNVLNRNLRPMRWFERE